MKTKKIVIGAMAATMLSLSVCSLAPAYAADNTVQITVGSANVEAGGQFTIDVKISDIPSTGIQACQFSLNFDSSVFKVDSVEAGPLLSSVTVDPASSVLPSFNSVLKDNYVNLMWATSVDESDYLLKGEGVFCTLKCTALSSASGSSDVKVAPTVRETYTGSGANNEDIDVGYNKSGDKVRYTVKTNDGTVKIGGGDTTTEKPTEKPTSGSGYLKGDANCDGKVNIADATAIVQSIANGDKYGLTEQGAKNADCDGEKGVTPLDAYAIQKLEAGIITEL